mmetsp:Transcript_26981/g.57173  ORF Transcript_26981/g.57173 Transcript_26981/m.57173 type:complete len:192 (+) Transcript_26981:57-632(+)
MGATQACEEIETGGDAAKASALRCQPDPAVVQHVGVDRHLEVLRQFEAAEQRGGEASKRLEEAQLNGKVTRRLVEQLSQEVDRLRHAVQRNEEALLHCREECGDLAQGKELAEQEHEQLRVDLAQACQELASARGEVAQLRGQLNEAGNARSALEARLQHCEQEGARARAACEHLQQTKIEQWLLHDGAVA